MKYYPRLKDLREDHNLDQEEIAKILKTTQPQYSRYERGEREIPIHKLVELCKLYNVTADYIIGLTDQPRPMPKDGRYWEYKSSR